MLACRVCGSARTVRRRHQTGWVETECRFCENIRRKQWLLTVRQEVLSHYGGACQCCGEKETDFLCIDHLNGDGHQHRERVGNIYPWLRSQGFPNKYQILCQNCNAAKERTGACPHKR